MSEPDRKIIIIHIINSIPDWGFNYEDCKTDEY